MRLGLFIFIGMTVCGPAMAQPATSSATSPTTAPTTRPRHEIVTPPGFVKVTAAERTALCMTADQDWVTKTLGDVQPTTRPTTMPSDLLDSLSNKKTDLEKQMAGDLGVTDAKPITDEFDNKLIPDLTKLANLRPPMFYLVCTKPQLLAAIHAGWSDPRFYYNRVADDVSVLRSVDLSVDRPMDDLLIPAVCQENDTPAQKAIDLQRQIDHNEANVAASLSMQGQIMVQTAFVAAIDKASIKPLSLKPGQEWLGVGVEGLLSARYATEVNGMRYDDLLKILVEDDPRNPIRASTINLLHPIPPNELTANYAPAYVDALRRKAVRAVNTLLTQGGPDALSKTLAAIKQAQPKDGEALIAVIKQTVNVDLGDQVLPK